jgi:hypothetical protein
MTWEYMTVVAPIRRSLFRGDLQAQGLTDRLDELGKEGWELVAISPTWFPWGGSRDLLLMLKRPVGSA